MLDLAKSFTLIVIYLLVFLSLGGLVLRILKTDFSISLGILSGFFFYHLLFSLVALPCILTQQTLTLLMSLWLPLLGVAVLLSVWLCRVTFLSAIRQTLTTCREHFRKPSSLLLPAAAAACVLFVLYLSVCSYYVGWDTAFYVRTTLHAVENDSMYTLDDCLHSVAAVCTVTLLHEQCHFLPASESPSAFGAEYYRRLYLCSAGVYGDLPHWPAAVPERPK